MSVGSDVEPLENMERRKRVLTTRFLTLGMIGILMISTLMSLGGYVRLQINETRALAERSQMQLMLSAKSAGENSTIPIEQLYGVVGQMAQSRLVNLQAAKLFDHSGREVWRARNYTGLPNNFDASVLDADSPYAVIAPELLKSQTITSLFTGDFELTQIAALIPIKGKRATMVFSIDNTNGYDRQRSMALRLMIFLLLSTSLLFVLLYFTFLRGIRTIDEQEQRLNQQISSLSNLLTINKSMQRNIRTASARAVELNEQFLRRTGADLHDGPAQMIGFSVMRLNQALEKDESGLIGPEFHAIKQALEESLEEIRGISSGLVLPELENMTLEQCMRKVVMLHTSVHKTEVNEFYPEIEREIPLPIKISAYRFVQEGLNNAQKHGQADKCRLSITFKDDLLQISLKDNGVGFRKSQLTNDGKHLGLIGMKDRIESLGGRLAINSELGVGTSLKLSVPISDEF